VALTDNAIEALHQVASTPGQRALVMNVLPHVHALGEGDAVVMSPPLTADVPVSHADLLIRRESTAPLLVQMEGGDPPTTREVAGWTVLRLPADGPMRSSRECAAALEEALRARQTPPVASATRRRRAAGTGVWAAVGVVVIVLVAALWLSSGADDGPLDWQQASQSLGQTVTVRDRIVAVTPQPDVTGSPTFVNFGAAFPVTPRFDVVLFDDVRAADPDLDGLSVGQTVCVTGVVEVRGGTAQIVPDTPGQISEQC
jgi:hypothetical protein